MKGLILGATIGNCIHVAGLLSFLRLAESEGYETCFLGMRITPEKLAHEITNRKPVLVAISYRLTPDTITCLLEELKAALTPEILATTRFAFGGTPPAAEVAKSSGLFSRVFSGGENLDEVREFLRGAKQDTKSRVPAQTLVERIAERFPYPLIRHHFGRPTLEETVNGAREIALSGVLDVLSLGPDQNAQEHFFNPEQMDHAQDGAGGVPLRRPEDLDLIYQATRCGNYPLVRCYSGTRDLLHWAKMSLRKINIAWGAIPLCWYSQLDSRSRRPLLEALRENISVIRWYAQQGVPIEVNESHQWSLRNAPDTVAVATAFLAAYNAKQCGVRHYVSQYMFNTPPGTTAQMDLAKMLAKQELINSLEDENFTVFRQVRAGLAALSPRAGLAKGQMAASGVISLAMKPHIFHVVGYSEGDHATYAEELIESCEIAHGLIKLLLDGLPNLAADEIIQQRRAELISDARYLLERIRSLDPGNSDPLADPVVLTRAVEEGLLDAPGLCGNPHAKGQVTTAIVNGACRLIDRETGYALSERERLERIC